MIPRVTLGEAVQLLRDGGVLIFPTETSYALGCDATNDEAVARVFAIKGRPQGKGVPLILPPDHDPEKYVVLSDRARELMHEYWPGPLNVVAPRAETSPVAHRCETDATQSVRKSSHAIVAQLASTLGRPLVATSANRSGANSIHTSAEIDAEFTAGEVPDAIIDHGDLPIVPASTAVKIEGDTVKVLRQGVISISPDA